MQNLPAELIEHIFDYLNLEERIRLRNVCKTFKYLIDNLKSNGDYLLISETDIHLNRDIKTWFIEEYKPIKQHQLYLPAFKIERLFTKSYRTVLNKLKNLIFYIKHNYKGENKILNRLFSNVNSFQNLEKLHIEKWFNIDYDDYHRNVQLNLPKLTIIYLDSVTLHNLHLNLPKLTRIVLDCDLDETNLTFQHPETVQFIHLDSYKSVLKELKNLEYLYCSNMENADDHLLASFVNLKEIHLFRNADDQIVKLIDQKQLLRKEDLRIYLNGVRLDNLEDYRNFVRKKSDKDIINIYCSGEFDLADSIPSSVTIFYDEIEKNSLYLSEKLVEKFVRLDVIYASEKVNNQANLERFISICKRASIIDIFNAYLNQSFFDKLPLIAPNVLHLELVMEFIDTKKCDFEFVLGLKFIEYFRSVKNVPRQLIKKMLKELKYLSTLECGIFTLRKVYPKDENSSPYYYLGRSEEAKFPTGLDAVLHLENEEYKKYHT